MHTPNHPAHDTPGAPSYVATSDVLAQLLAELPAGEVDLAWLLSRLQERAFGFLMLLLALVGMVPGIATFATILMPVLAVQMVLGRKNPVLPHFVASKTISSERFSNAIARLIPPFRRMEKLVHHRWHTPVGATQRFVGGVFLVLTVATFAPLPFYQVPTLAIMLLAFAYLEEDGILLTVSLLAAVLSVGFIAASVLATVKAFGFIARLWSRS
jgi:hypothetical protein